MKLHEITNIFRSAIPMAETVPIYNTLEYFLADSDAQSEAFTLHSPVKTPAELFAEFNDRPFIDAGVIINDGTSRTIKLECGRWGLVVPAEGEFEREIYYKGTRYYMLNSVANPKAKSAKFFTEAHIKASPQYAELAGRYRQYLKETCEKHQLQVLQKLRSTLSSVAQKALTENLQNLVKQNAFQQLHDWFVAEDFSNVPAAEEFKKMRNLSGWCVKSEQVYGHEQGVNLVIDWKNKRFYTMGWSSDD
ncbi:MAG: hypothetical protein QXN55_00515 [Candidatus Nitrosotenuis sp.]